VRGNSLSVGDATSGASERANADTFTLYSYLWANFSQTQCPVTGGRGASATIDFNAHKPIQLLDMRGRGAFGVDNMGATAAGRLTGVTFAAGNATTPGATGGEGAHLLVTGEIPAHTHPFSGDTGTESALHTHTLPQSRQDGDGNIPASTYNDTAGLGRTTPSSTESATHTHHFSGTTGSIGGGATHNNMPPFMLGTWFIKL
jgi:microcystin-dependent protein